MEIVRSHCRVVIWNTYLRRDPMSRNSPCIAKQMGAGSSRSRALVRSDLRLDHGDRYTPFDSRDSCFEKLSATMINAAKMKVNAI